jgi:hypothetical protein
MTKPDREPAMQWEDAGCPQPTDSALLANRERLAFGRLSEDAMLTGDLTDDVATELLRWAQEKVRTLVAATSGLDDEEAWELLDPQLHRLRRRLRRNAKLTAAAGSPHTTLKALLTAPDDELCSDEQA